MTTPCNDADSRSARILAYVDVVHALCDLTHTERTALRLIYWHGRSQAQVAAELRLPVSTIRSAVAHGLQQIAAHLTERRPFGTTASNSNICVVRAPSAP